MTNQALDRGSGSSGFIVQHAQLLSQEVVMSKDRTYRRNHPSFGQFRAFVSRFRVRYCVYHWFRLIFLSVSLYWDDQLWLTISKCSKGILFTLFWKWCSSVNGQKTGRVNHLKALLVSQLRNVVHGYNRICLISHIKCAYMYILSFPPAPDLLYLSHSIRFQTMWYVQLAKPQISLCIRTVWSLEWKIIIWSF